MLHMTAGSGFVTGVARAYLIKVDLFTSTRAVQSPSPTRRRRMNGSTISRSRLEHTPLLNPYRACLF
jgi:hypothetical protein